MATEATLKGALFGRVSDFTHRSRRPEDPKVSVVIPALNEAESLAFVLPKIDRGLHEVILVDGGSKDETVAVARRLYPGIRVLPERGMGKGAALRTGFYHATGDIIVTLDADGSNDPGEIPAFVGILRAGADFAKGSRFVQGAGTRDMPLHRRLGNRGLVLLVRLFFGGRYSDLCYGYNGLWADTLPKLDLDCDGFEIETLMNIRALKTGLKVVEVASFEHPRRHGIPKLRAIPDGWRVLVTIFAEWRSHGRTARRRAAVPAHRSIETRDVATAHVRSAAEAVGDDD